MRIPNYTEFRKEGTDGLRYVGHMNVALGRWACKINRLACFEEKSDFLKRGDKLIQLSSKESAAA